MVTFVHTADWQLGMRRHYLDDDAQGRFAQARLDAVQAVGRLAEEVDAAFVVVAGDAFDDNQVDRRTLLRALEVLSGFPDIPVFVLPGNHDPLDTGSVYRRPEFEEQRPHRVTVLADPAPRQVVPGVEVVGAPWTGKHPVEDPAAETLRDLRPPPGVHRVLVAHGACDAVVQDAGQAGLIRAELLRDALGDGRIDFAALGDRHSATRVDERIWYSGAPEPTAYVEDNPGKALVVDLGPGAVHVEERHVGTWRFRQAVFEVTGSADVDRVRRWLDEPADKPRTVARLALRGSVSLRDRQALDSALAEAAETYAALEGWERQADLVTAPDEVDLTNLDVGGFVRAAVDELRETAQAEAETATAAGDALGLLHRVVTRT